MPAPGRGYCRAGDEAVAHRRWKTWELDAYLAHEGDEGATPVASLFCALY